MKVLDKKALQQAERWAAEARRTRRLLSSGGGHVLDVWLADGDGGEMRQAGTRTGCRSATTETPLNLECT